MNQEHSKPKILGQALLSTGAAVLFPFVIGAIIGVMFLIISIFLNFFPSYAFYKATNFYPPVDVMHLETSGSLFQEEDGVWLKFEASQQTVNTLLEDDFVEVNKKEIRIYNSHLKNFVDNEGSKFYKNDINYRILPKGKSLIVYNPKTQKVFYLKRGSGN